MISFSQAATPLIHSHATKNALRLFAHRQHWAPCVEFIPVRVSKRSNPIREVNTQLKNEIKFRLQSLKYTDNSLQCGPKSTRTHGRPCNCASRFQDRCGISDIEESKCYTWLDQISLALYHIEGSIYILLIRGNIGAQVVIRIKVKLSYIDY